MSKHKAIGPSCSGSQRLVEQLTEKQAIVLSQRPTNKIPLLVCEAPKTWVMVDPGCDMEAKRVHFLRRYMV